MTASARDTPPPKTSTIVAHIALTAIQLDALTRLAGKGRVLMDVDPNFLRRRDQREAARTVLSTLRRLNAAQMEQA